MKKYVLLFLLMPFWCLAQNELSPRTRLVIFQESDSIYITDTVSYISLKAEPFKFVFETYDTDAVYLNCSYDSTAYLQILNHQQDSLTCFYSPQTFSEDIKNYSHDIIVVKDINRGYHCLFAYHEDDQFVRFDSTVVFDKNHWIGVRTVETIFVPRIGEVSLSELQGSFLYFVYSPSDEKSGWALRIQFE